MKCLTGARFTMKADVLRPDFETSDDDSPVEGDFESYQDPITGAILRRWVPGTEEDPITGTPASSLRTIDCLARGIVDGGIRVAGTTERFGDTYENIDFVKLWVPAKIKLSKRDRITNIRKGTTVMWKDEEGDGAATVFNVNGVTPLFDAFNKHTEDFVLLEKAYGKD
jgi:hypothetical protein